MVWQWHDRKKIYFWNSDDVESSLDVLLISGSFSRFSWNIHWERRKERGREVKRKGNPLLTKISLSFFWFTYYLNQVRKMKGVLRRSNLANCGAHLVETDVVMCLWNESTNRINSKVKRMMAGDDEWGNWKMEWWVSGGDKRMRCCFSAAELKEKMKRWCNEDCSA